MQEFSFAAVELDDAACVAEAAIGLVAGEGRAVGVLVGDQDDLVELDLSGERDFEGGVVEVAGADLHKGAIELSGCFDAQLNPLLSFVRAIRIDKRFMNSDAGRLFWAARWRWFAGILS